MLRNDYGGTGAGARRMGTVWGSVGTEFHAWLPNQDVGQIQRVLDRPRAVIPGLMEQSARTLSFGEFRSWRELSSGMKAIR